MNPDNIVKWLEVLLLALIILVGSVASSVYISGLVFHNLEEGIIHLNAEYWNCTKYESENTRAIPAKAQCIEYQRSY